MARKWWTLVTVLGMIDAYSLSLAAVMLVVGSLGDRLGHRRVFATGLVAFSISSLLCGLAPDPLLPNVARAVQGLAMVATSPARIAQDSERRRSTRDAAACALAGGQSKGPRSGGAG